MFGGKIEHLTLQNLLFRVSIRNPGGIYLAGSWIEE
jgi:hypothetical protein